MDRSIDLTVPALDLAAAVRSGALSALDVVEASLGRIADLDGGLHAFTVVLADEARRAAEGVDARLAAGEELPLAGVPVSVKDLVWISGVPVTAGSRALADFVPGETSVVVERLTGAGAVVVGMTNMPEFGYRGDTASSMWGITRNPWNTDLVPGGSSSGAGVSVATAMVAAAVGTDAGGSIRNPAAFCGTVGHKPTLGLVPTKPGFRSWPMLSVTGPLTRTVADAAAVLEVMAGPDSRDPDSAPGRGHDLASAGADLEDLSGWRIAVSEDLGFARLDPEIRRAFAEVVESFSHLGCRLTEAHPATLDPLPVWFTLATAAIHVAHGRFLERADELAPDSVRWIRMGEEMRAAEYVEAVHARFELTQAWSRFFDDYDLVLYPGQQMLPYPIAEEVPGTAPADAVEGGWGLDTVANVTGQPALFVPSGLGASGLPVGFQLMGRRFDDRKVLAAARVFERRTGRLPLLPPVVPQAGGDLGAARRP